MIFLILDGDRKDVHGNGQGIGKDAEAEVRRCAEALRRGVQLPVAEPEVLEAQTLGFAFEMGEKNRKET